MPHEEEKTSAAESAAQEPVNTTPPISFLTVFKDISHLAIPMALSFTFSFEVFLSVILLERLSENEDEVAAATLVSTYVNAVAVFFISPLFAVAIYLSHKLGDWREAIEAQPPLSVERLNEKKEIIASTNANALLIASVAAIPSTLLLYYSNGVLASVFQQEAAVVQATQPYLRTFAFAIPGLLSRLSLEQIMFSFKKTKPAMLMGLTNLGVGVVIALGLGFGFDTEVIKIPKWGPRGVALGFLVETYMSALAYGLYVAFNKDIRKFQFFNAILRRVQNGAQQRWDILKLGRSISFTTCLELSIMLMVGIFSGLAGTRSQAAMTYYMQFAYFQLIVLMAFSFSCAQELSRAIGSIHYLEANRVGRYGFLTTMLWLTPASLVFALYPKGLASDASNEILAVLEPLAPIMSAGVIFEMIRYNLLQQLRAMDDLAIPNIISFLGTSLGILLMGILGLRTSLGVNGVAVGYLLGVGLSTVALSVRWSKQIHALGQAQPLRLNGNNTYSAGLLCSFFRKSPAQERGARGILSSTPPDIELGASVRMARNPL